MVGMASIKRERIRFNNYSTSTCGLRRKNLTEQTLLEKDLGPNKTEEEFLRMVRVVDREIWKEKKGGS